MSHLRFFQSDPMRSSVSSRRLRRRAVVVPWVVLAVVASAGAADDPFDADPFAGLAEPGAVARRAEPIVDAPIPGDPRGERPLEDVEPPVVVAVSLPLPITGSRDKEVEAAIQRSLPKLEGQPGRRGVLVLSFDADDGGAGSDFGRSLALARFLAGPRLAGVKTVAYLPRTVRGHAVLVALACEEIVMAPDAVLGPANADEPTVDETVRAGYRQIADIRRAVPPAIALALVDPKARTVRAVTGDGEVFIAESDLPDLRRRQAVLEVEELQPAPIAPTGRRGRTLGIVRLLASTPAEVERGLGLGPDSLKADAVAVGGWKSREIVVAGPLEAASVSRLKSQIEQAVSEGVNFLCIRVDTDGGSPERSLAIAESIAAIDPSAVRTVAYVPRAARADAALVALACDEIVMHPDAVLGGEGAAPIEDRTADAIAAAWREGVAAKKGRSWSLPVAMVKRGVVVRRATARQSGAVDLLSETELIFREDRDAWDLGPQIGVGPIELSGRTAESLGLATHLVESPAGLLKAYGLESPMEVVRPRWSDTLLEALASPGIAWLLLVIGGVGIYLELHTPGVGLGGFIAMVAFIIYFWGQHLHGTSGWLEVMLFLAGLFCLAAEIFVLPGFGVLGLGGGLLVIASIVLASQSFVLPSNAYQIRQMQWSIGGILAALASVVAVAAVLRRWLPSAPGLRHMMLEPPLPETFDAEEFSGLLGLEGVATTRLVPAGKARIDGRVFEVTTDGRLIEPGRPVRVEAVRGGRIIVAETNRSAGA
jgi:membrane-bound ClpP family serine protease